MAIDAWRGLTVFSHTHEPACARGTYCFKKNLLRNLYALYANGGVAPPVTGQWWWRDDGAFCFQGNGSENPTCKSNGHYIGRTPINNLALLDGHGSAGQGSEKTQRSDLDAFARAGKRRRRAVR